MSDPEASDPRDPVAEMKSRRSALAARQQPRNDHPDLAVAEDEAEPKPEPKDEYEQRRREAHARLSAHQERQAAIVKNTGIRMEKVKKDLAQQQAKKIQANKEEHARLLEENKTGGQHAKNKGAKASSHDADASVADVSMKETPSTS